MFKAVTHCVIPDMQIRPGVPTWQCSAIGNYIAEKRPDRVICLGDWFDFPSLSSYDVGKASAEGRRFLSDLKAGQDAMDMLMDRPKSVKGYRPGWDFTLGNHCDRIDREAEANPKFAGLLTTEKLGLIERGWTVHGFLKPVKIDGILYAHYFTSGVMGRPVSSARALLQQQHCSAVQGHVQLVDIAVHPKTQHIGLFAGIAYAHDEKYLGHQGNNTKRGIWMLHEVHDGTFDPMFVSLGFLKRRYS